MDMESLQVVAFGDPESLKLFLFENGLQHKLFWQQLNANGIETPQYPIIDADTNNLDDWLLVHQNMHQVLAESLNLNNPFFLLDSDWNVEIDFYDWIANHYDIHVQIAQTLGIAT